MEALLLKVLAKTAALRLDTISYNSAVSACQKADKWRPAVNLLAELICLHLQGDIISYNAVYTACRSISWRKASSLVEAIQHQDLEPTIRSCNAALSASCRKWQWKSAFQVLACLGRRLQASEVTSSIAISACEKNALWQCALALLVDFSVADLPVNAISYGASVSAFEKAEQWRCVHMLLAKFYARSFRANAVILSAVVSAFAKGTRWETALLAFVANSSQANLMVCSSALSACQKGQLWELASELARDLTDRKAAIDDVALTTITDAYGTAKKWQPALSMIRRVRQGLVQDSVLLQDAVLLATRSLSTWRRVLLQFAELFYIGMQPSVTSYDAAILACEVGNQSRLLVSLLAMLSGAAAAVTMRQHLETAAPKNRRMLMLGVFKIVQLGNTRLSTRHSY